MNIARGAEHSRVVQQQEGNSMSAERDFTQPEIDSEALQEKLDEACSIFMEADARIERLQKDRDIAWEAFNYLREQLSVAARIR